MDPALQRSLDDARAGRLPHAIAAVRRILAVKPGSIDALQVLALLLSQAGQLDQAAAQLARAVELSPAAPRIRNNYANILIQMRRYADAAAQARRAVDLSASYIPGHIALSCALLYLPETEAAIAAARRGLEIAPDSPELSKNLVLALDQAGRTEEALAVAEAAHRANPGSADLHSVYLMLLNYSDRPATEIAAEHRRYGELHPSSAPPVTDRDPDRVLRIGVLSADLRTHSVAYFLEPLLRHTPPWAQVHCFSLMHAPKDPLAARLRGEATSWEEVGHLDDPALSARLRSARIDVLLELMGHTGGNRLAALAAKPAPVILTAIGYPNTTGLGAIDGRVVDSITDPPGAEAYATERLLRIDPCFLCYTPPGDAPEPSEPDGPITFGSFNAPSKIGPRAAALWAAVLEAVAGSRLVLKARELGEASARGALLERLSRAGIDPGRVTILPATAVLRDHLALYSRVHIALDTVPYNGTTTTCEALWMGVPVVTLIGDRHAARVGTSLLTAAGHPEWIATSRDQYIRVAAALAGDRAALSRRRSELREELARSTLCDAACYAARVYAALRACWRGECARS